MKNIKSEVQQKPDQLEREMERRKAQQMNEIARRGVVKDSADSADVP